MQTVTINAQQRLFVIPCGGGYSCMGFDNVYQQLCLIAEKLQKAGRNLCSAFGLSSDGATYTNKDQIGTLAQYSAYRNAVDFMAKSGLKFGTWFSLDTPKKVQRILEDYRRSGKKIRVFYGDPETGRDWMEENDVLGRIGRSTGVMQIPLLVPDGECGGPGLLDDRIVRLMDAETHKELYRHPSYHQKTLAIIPSTVGKGYTHAVRADGETVANFKSMGAAAHYVAFMAGESMEQPRG